MDPQYSILFIVYPKLQLLYYIILYYYIKLNLIHYILIVTTNNYGPVCYYNKELIYIQFLIIFTIIKNLVLIRLK